MIRAIKKWLQYRRMKAFHMDWAGFFVFAGNFRKAHYEFEKMRRLTCIWKGKPYNFFPYMEALRMQDPQFHADLARLGLNLT